MAGGWFLDAARQEFLAAAEHYDSVAPGLGSEFIEELESAVERIATLPDLGNPYLAGTRRILLRRFPFQVIYLKDADQIVIVAVAHSRRRPGYWKDRTPPE